jgi:hypothetical protein
MKIKKTRFGDYRKNVVFEVMARYIAHIVFSEDVAKSCAARYGSCKAHDDAVAFVRHSTIDGRTHMFFPFDSDPGTIAHEAWHVIYHMFDWIGVKDFDNEFTAYHVGYLVEQIHKFQIEVKNHVSETKTSCGTTTTVQGLHT